MAEIRRAPRVVVVAEHASERFGGEAMLPLHIFRGLRRRGIEAWLVIHSRTRDELLARMPQEARRIRFIPETWLHRLLHRIGRHLPARLGYFSVGLASRISTLLVARAMVRRLVAEHEIDVVHQPIPVSPMEPSVIYDLGVPVIMGPLNGGMSYPPAFRKREGVLVTTFVALGRRAASLVHAIVPGKLRAELLIVANDRARAALPDGCRGEVHRFCEIGVDLSLWKPAEAGDRGPGPIEFLFVGRLIPCKAVDLLLEAFREVSARIPARLTIVGDGPLGPQLREQAEALGLGNSVTFLGWLPQVDCAGLYRRADIFVMPSLMESGGAVVLEAMATGLPVIAAHWGGPADYLDESCGILVEPDSRDGFVRGLIAAMLRLAGDPATRQALGRAGRDLAVREFDWEAKIDRFLALYDRARGVEQATASAETEAEADPPGGRDGSGRKQIHVLQF